MSNKKYIVSSTPHIRSSETVNSIMLNVLIALAPAALCGIYYFGFNSALIIAISILTAIGSELIYQKITKRPITINDLSAVVTGLLLAMNLPPTVPFWLPIIGSIFAIIIVKQLFGGLGQNFMNPALAARAFLLASYPTQMTTWINPDAISTPTPLALISYPQPTDYYDAFLGNIGGCIGETAAFALIIGGIYLIYKKVITWHIPILYLLTVFVLSAIFGREGFFMGYPLYELLVGGLLLGAFFMATDYSSSPITPMGKIIMGIGCGVFTVIIRVYGGYPEGVSYSILLMNLTVPLIDKYTKPKVFGVSRKREV